MNDDVEAGPNLLDAYRLTLEAFRTVEQIPACTDGFGNAAMLELRGDLSHTARRIRNLALYLGLPPKALEDGGTR